MARVKLDFSDKSVADKLAAAQTVMTASAGNPVVPALQPKLTALSTAHYNLNAGANVVGPLEADLAEAYTAQNTAEEALDKAYGEFATVL